MVELRTALDRIKADIGLTTPSQPKRQMEHAAERIREVKEELIACRTAATKKELRPLPGDNVPNSIYRLTDSVRKVSTHTDQLVNSVVASDNTGATSSAQGVSSGLSDLVSAARAVASTSDEPRILYATEEVLERTWTLLRESSGILGTHERPEEVEMLLNPLAKGVHDALDKVTGSIPGQKDVEEAIQSISSTSMAVERGGRPTTAKNYG